VSTLTNMLGVLGGQWCQDSPADGAGRNLPSHVRVGHAQERYESSDKDEFEVGLWETRDFYLREIAPRTYLLTYTLWGQDDRLTRRLTVWQGSVEDGWQVLYHQGTIAD